MKKTLFIFSLKQLTGRFSLILFFTFISFAFFFQQVDRDASRVKVGPQRRDALGLKVVPKIAPQNARLARTGGAQHQALEPLLLLRLPFWLSLWLSLLWCVSPPSDPDRI